MQKSMRHWIPFSALGIGLVLVAGYFSRESHLKFRGTQADRELSIIREEYARQKFQLAELRRSQKSAELDAAEARFASWQEVTRKRCLQIADDHPGTRAEPTALLLVAYRWPESPEGKSASSRLLETASRSDIGSFAQALDSVQSRDEYTERWGLLATQLVDRVKSEPHHPKAALLLAKACRLVAPQADVESVPDEFVEIADLIRERYATSRDIANFLEHVGAPVVGDAPAWGRNFEPHVHEVLRVNQDRFVRCTAKMALATIVRTGGVERQPEARQILYEFMAEFDGEMEYPAIGIEQMYREVADRILDSIDTHGLGMPAPETVGFDLEGHPISLEDYRGQVVLVSFWATWCYPCMQAIPHEKSLLDRFGPMGFAIVGVNADRDPSTAQEAVAKYGIGWRSFQVENKDGSSIADKWHIAGYPTFYLLDQGGVVARTWLGMPSRDHLDDAIRKLLARPEAEKYSPADPMRAAGSSVGEGKTDIELPIEFAVDSQDATGFVERILSWENGTQLKYVVFVPNGYDSAKQYPTILYLHGTGGQGTDGRKHVTSISHAINRRKSSFPFMVIFPQARTGDWRPKSKNDDLALAVLDDVIEVYSVDPDRVALTGVSMGGEGTWSLAAAHPNRWCAIIPICGGGDPSTVTRFSRVPCWCFHGGSDRVIPPENSREMVRALRTAGGQPIYIEYPDIGHNCWDIAYSSDDLFSWLTQQQRWRKDVRSE